MPIHSSAVEFGVAPRQQALNTASDARSRAPNNSVALTASVPRKRAASKGRSGQKLPWQEKCNSPYSCHFEIGRPTLAGESFGPSIRSSTFPVRLSFHIARNAAISSGTPSSLPGFSGVSGQPIRRTFSARAGGCAATSKDKVGMY